MIKAGSVGSSPNGIAKTASFSIALTILLRDVGEAVANLNTLVVGLDAVERGHEKPDSLNISWKPADRQTAARKSRKFVLESVMVRVLEAFNQYVLAVTALPRFATLKVQWAAQTNPPTNAQRIADISNAILGEQYLTSAALLLAHWRNRIVHSSSSKAKLSFHERKLLLQNETEISDKYKSLSIERMLCHFEEGRPTLKDVSSLISMSINLARQLDNALWTNLDKEELDVWLEYYELIPLLNKIRSETKPEKIKDSIARMFATHAPSLYESYKKYYEIL